MNKKMQKAVVIFLAIVMIGSLIGSVIIYFIN